MIELSHERIKQMLHEETAGKEELSTILRGLYTRYMRLYERYFADIDALTNREIDALRLYHEETRSLFKAYYMDIPQDICAEIEAFEDRYTANLLGPSWRQYLFEHYDSFMDNNRGEYPSEALLKREFARQTLSAFYAAMDQIFRDGFGTGSQTAHRVVDEITGALFGKE